MTAISVIAGAAAGLAIAFGFGLTMNAFSILEELELLKGGAIIGAAFGLALGPIASLGFLRHVPLGRLFLETTLGAALGGLAGFALGFVTPPTAPGFLLVFPSSVAGFCLACVNLRRRFRAPRSEA